MPARRTRGRHGFTLIEILAVVLIIGLTFGFFLPNLDATRARRLEDRARELAGRLQMARERALVTGAAHRVWLDLESGAMRIEWFVDEERAMKALGLEPEEPAPAPVPGMPGVPAPPSGRQEVSLDPPQAAERQYFPIPGRFGDVERLPRDYAFVGIEGPDGWVDFGEVQIVFGRDGTTDYAEIFIADAWENEVVLEVQPIQDVVRVFPVEEGRS